MKDEVTNTLSVSKKKYVVQIDKNSLLIFIMLCMTVRLSYVASLSVGSMFYRIGTILVFCYMIAIFIISKSVQISFVARILCLYQVLVAISTILYSGINVNNLFVDLYPIALILMFDYFIKKFPKQTINASAFFFEILIYINCLAEFFFPAGLYNTNLSTGKNYYLFGHQNQVGLFLLVALLLGFIRFEMSNSNPKKITDLRLFCLFAVGLISVIRVWSVTSLIGIIAFLFVYLVQITRTKGFPIPAFWAVIINLVIFAILALFQNTGWMEQIMTLFGRSNTITGRTRIWASALNTISNHLLLGVGSAQGELLEGYDSAHNRYLNTLFIGGIIAFAVFLFYLFYCCRKLQKNNNRILTFGLVAYFWAVLIMCQAETYTGPVFFLAFIIIQNQDYVFNQCKFHREVIST